MGKILVWRDNRVFGTIIAGAIRTVDKNRDKRNNNVVFTERKSDLELHHFTQLGAFTHEKRRDPAAFSALPTTATIQLYERRIQSHEYDRPRNVASPYLRWLDERRSDVFHAKEIFTSERFLSLTWRLPTSSKSNVASAFDSGAVLAGSTDAAYLAELDALCASVESQFGATLTLRRLGERLELDGEGAERRRSDRLAFVASVINGSDAPFNATLPGTPLDELLAVDFIGAYQPMIGGRSRVAGRLCDRLFGCKFCRILQL